MQAGPTRGLMPVCPKEFDPLWKNWSLYACVHLSQGENHGYSHRIATLFRSRGLC